MAPSSNVAMAPLTASVPGLSAPSSSSSSSRPRRVLSPSIPTRKGSHPDSRSSSSSYSQSQSLSNLIARAVQARAAQQPFGSAEKSSNFGEEDEEEDDGYEQGVAPSIPTQYYSSRPSLSGPSSDASTPLASHFSSTVTGGPTAKGPSAAQRPATPSSSHDRNPSVASSLLSGSSWREYAGLIDADTSLGEASAPSQNDSCAPHMSPHRTAEPQLSSFAGVNASGLGIAGISAPGQLDYGDSEPPSILDSLQRSPRTRNQSLNSSNGSSSYMSKSDTMPAFGSTPMSSVSSDDDQAVPNQLSTPSSLPLLSRSTGSSGDSFPTPASFSSARLGSQGNSPHIKRKPKPHNLALGGIASPPTSHSIKGLPSPVVRGRTPPPTNPPAEPLPPLPATASAYVSSFAKRGSGDGSGAASTVSTSTSSVRHSDGSRRDSYSSSGNAPSIYQNQPANAPSGAMSGANPPAVPASSGALQQAVASDGPPLRPRTASTGTSASRADPPRAAAAVATNHMETIAGAQSAAAVLKAVQLEATYDETHPAARNGNGHDDFRDSDDELSASDDEIDPHDQEGDGDGDSEVAIVRRATLASPARAPDGSSSRAPARLSVGLSNAKAEVLRSASRGSSGASGSGSAERPPTGVSSGLISRAMQKLESSGVNVLQTSPRQLAPNRADGAFDDRIRTPISANGDSSKDDVTPHASSATVNVVNNGAQPVVLDQPQRRSAYGLRGSWPQSPGVLEEIADATSGTSSGGQSQLKAPALNNKSSEGGLLRRLEMEKDRGSGDPLTPHEKVKRAEGRFAGVFGEIAVAFRQLQAEKRTLEKVVRATTPLDGIGEGGEDFIRYLTTMNSKLEMSSTEIQKLLDLLERQRSVMDYMLETHQEDVDSHLDEIDDLRDELDVALQNAETLRVTITRLREELDKAQSEAFAARAEAIRVRAGTAEESNKREQAIKALEHAQKGLQDKDKKVRELGERHASLESQHQALQAEHAALQAKLKDSDGLRPSRDIDRKKSVDLSSLEAEIEALRQAHEDAIASMGAEHERDIWNLKEEHERNLSEHNAEIEKAAEQLMGHHSEALAVLQSEHAQTVDELQARIAAMESSQEASISAKRNLMEVIDAKDEQIAELTHELSLVAEQRDGKSKDGEIARNAAEAEKLDGEDLSEALREAKERAERAEMEKQEATKTAQAEQEALKAKLQEQAAELEKLRAAAAASSEASAHARYLDSPISAIDEPTMASTSGTAKTKPSTTETGIAPSPSASPPPSADPRSGSETDQIRHLTSQLQEQRAREAQIRSAYRQLRDEHRRLQNSHKDVSERRRGSVSTFNLNTNPLATPVRETPASANGHGSSGGWGWGGRGSGAAESPGGIGMSPGCPFAASGAASSGSSGRLRDLKRLSLPIASKASTGSIGGAPNGGSVTGGFSEHIVAALGGAATSPAVSPGTSRRPESIHLNSRPPNAYRAPSWSLGNGAGSRPGSSSGPPSASGNSAKRGYRHSIQALFGPGSATGAAPLAYAEAMRQAHSAAAEGQGGQEVMRDDGEADGDDSEIEKLMTPLGSPHYPGPTPSIRNGAPPPRKLSSSSLTASQESVEEEEGEESAETEKGVAVLHSFDLGEEKKEAEPREAE